MPGVEFDVKLEENSKVACHIICIFDDSNEDSICRLQSKIEEVKKLEDKEDYYTLNEFETILYNIGVIVPLVTSFSTWMAPSCFALLFTMRLFTMKAS